MKTTNKYSGNIEKEKLRLRVKQLELEKQIRKEWEDVKAGLSLSNLFANRTSAHNANDEKGFFSEAFNYGIKYFTNRVSGFASEKIESGMKKGIDKLKDKLKTVFTR